MRWHESYDSEWEVDDGALMARAVTQMQVVTPIRQGLIALGVKVGLLILGTVVMAITGLAMPSALGWLFVAGLAAVLAGLGVGIYHRSRIAAVLLVGVQVVDIVIILLEASVLATSLAGVFMYYFVRMAIACFRYHRY